MRWFNYQRNNYYKGGSPLKLFKETNENNYPPEIFDLTPVLLDNHINKPAGYNLPVRYRTDILKT
jgi:hypothetical protein